MKKLYLLTVLLVMAFSGNNLFSQTVWNDIRQTRDEKLRWTSYAVTSHSYNYENNTPQTSLSWNNDRLPERKIRVYPNPVVDNLTIDADMESPVQVMIYTINGRLVYDQKNVYSIPVSNWHQGIYLVRVVTDYDTRTFKIVKN